MNGGQVTELSLLERSGNFVNQKDSLIVCKAYGFHLITLVGRPGNTPLEKRVTG